MNDLDKLFDNENHDNIITTGLRASFDKDDINASEDLMAKTLARIAQLDADKQAGGSEVNKFIMAEEDFAISDETGAEQTEKQSKVIDIASRRRKFRIATGIAAAVVVAVLGISLINNGLMGASKSEKSSTGSDEGKMIMSKTFAVADTACVETSEATPMYESSEEAAPASAYAPDVYDSVMAYGAANGGDEEGEVLSESRSSMMVGSGNPFASADGYDGEDDLLEADALPTNEMSLSAENGIVVEELPREALTVSKTEFITKQEMPDAETAYNSGFAFFTKEFFEKMAAEVTDGFISGELKDVETGSTVTDGAVYGQIKLIDISDTDYVLFSYILFTATDENGDTVVRGFGEGKICNADGLTRYMISADKAELDEDYRGAEKGSLAQGLWEDVEVNRCIVPEGDLWEIRYEIFDWTFYDDESGYGLFSYYSRLFFDENGASVFMTKRYCPDGDMDTPYEIYFVRDDKLIFTGYWDAMFIGDYPSTDGRYSMAVNGDCYDRVLDLWYDGALLVHDDNMYHGY